MVTAKKNIVFGGNFNLIFDQKFDASGGNPILKKNFIAKLIEIKETLFLCDILRIRNSNVRRFTFRQNHLSLSLNKGLVFFELLIYYKSLSLKQTFLLPFAPTILRYFFLYNEMICQLGDKVYGNLTII